MLSLEVVWSLDCPQKVDSASLLWNSKSQSFLMMYSYIGNRIYPLGLATFLRSLIILRKSLVLQRLGWFPLLVACQQKSRKGF